jgi:hypothetical protein
MSDDALSDGGAVEADTKSVLHRVVGSSAAEMDRSVIASAVACAPREVRQ